MKIVALSNFSGQPIKWVWLESSLTNTLVIPAGITVPHLGIASDTVWVVGTNAAYTMTVDTSSWLDQSTAVVGYDISDPALLAVSNLAGPDFVFWFFVGFTPALLAVLAQWMVRFLNRANQVTVDL